MFVNKLLSESPNNPNVPQNADALPESQRQISSSDEEDDDDNTTTTIQQSGGGEKEEEEEAALLKIESTTPHTAASSTTTSPSSTASPSTVEAFTPATPSPTNMTTAAAAAAASAATAAVSATISVIDEELLGRKTTTELQTEQHDRIVILHKTAGIRLFNSGSEAAFFLLAADGISLFDFARHVKHATGTPAREQQNQALLQRYSSLTSQACDGGGSGGGPRTNGVERAFMDPISPNELADLPEATDAAGGATGGGMIKKDRSPCRCFSAGPGVGVMEDPTCSTNPTSMPMERCSSSGLSGQNGGSAKRARRSTSSTVVSDDESNEQSDQLDGGGGLATMHSGSGLGGGDASAPSDIEDGLIDRSLAQSMHIPLNQRGEMVSFKEVRKWVNPTRDELTELKDRLVKLWMNPLKLRQQDIVKATGVGAPYICYFFKDPDNPNMTQRRKIESFSVLSELYRKYAQNIITDDDFIALKLRRIQSRRHRSQNNT